MQAPPSPTAAPTSEFEDSVAYWRLSQPALSTDTDNSTQVNSSLAF